jgi:hypothetical protein
MLIHKLQSITHTHTRQLAFTPSVGRSADALAPPPFTSATSISIKRDGRYRLIDPVQATLQTLRNLRCCPTNKKHRLPLRADVGFPNASQQAIAHKQQEIAFETEWEEASPRLIVLVTSDDYLGTAVQEEVFGGPQLRR